MALICDVFLLVYAPFLCYAVMNIKTNTESIVASKCSDVLLDCQFTPDSMPITFDKLVLSWKFQGQRVIEFDDKVESSWDTAQLFPEELKKGNASLLLRRVEKSVAGKYVCEVLYSPDKESVALTLTITDQMKDCSHNNLTGVIFGRKGDHNGIDRAKGETAVLAFVGMLLALLLQ